VMFLIISLQLAALLLVTAEDVPDVGETAPVISASAFLNRLHVKEEAQDASRAIPRVQQGIAVARREQQQAVHEIESAHQDLAALMPRAVKVPMRPAQEVHMIQSDEEELVELGASMEGRAGLGLAHLSDAERARLNLQAAQAFPSEAREAEKLRMQLPQALHRMNSLAESHAAALRAVAKHNARVNDLEDRDEFELMTNPKSEQAEIEAENKLQDLRYSELHLAHRLHKAKSAASQLAAQLGKQEKMKILSQKSLMLFKKFKGKYTVQMKAEKKKFSARALAAAEKTAKQKYNNYVKAHEKKFALDIKSREDRKKMRALRHAKRRALRHATRAERRKARLLRRADRQQHRALTRAKWLAEEHAAEKREVQAMFKQYVARFRQEESERDEEETLASTSSMQDLGESSSVGDLGESSKVSGPVQASDPASHSHAVDPLEKALDAVQASVVSVPFKKSKVGNTKALKEPKAFGLDTN